MDKYIFRKGLVIGIIILLVGASFSASIGENITNVSTDNNINIIFKNLQDEEWNKTFGGYSEDRGRCVQSTSDGGFIIYGYTHSFGSGNVSSWLIKTDVNGNMEWNKTYLNSIWQQLGIFVQQTSDGGYILLMNGFESTTYNTYLIKTNQNGNMTWYKQWEAGANYGRCVKQTSDGGYIILTSHPYLIKTDSSGNTIWSKSLSDYCLSLFYVDPTSDGGYILTGNVFAIYEANLVLIKTDNTGDVEWDKSFNTSYEWSGETGRSVRQTSDDGYIVCGYATQFDGGQVYLIKTDSDGNEEWSKLLGEGPSVREFAYSHQICSDGGYIITGESWNYGSGNNYIDVLLIRTDEDGNELWYHTYGGTSQDVGYSVDLASNGGYIVVGDTGSFGSGGSDLWLIKISQYETPTADADGPYYGYTNAPITFNGTSSHDNDENGCCIVQYDWKYFDGDIWHNDIGATPTYTYSSVGIYNVTLRVYDDEGATDEDKTKAYIYQGNIPPMADFIWTPLNPNPSETITFNASDSYDLDGTIDLYEWDWDDDGNYDESSSNPIITHDFDESGSYPVMLRVTDNATATDNITKNVDVVDNLPPIADFSWYPPNPIPPGNVEFDASNSYDSDGYIVLYSWDFDNDGEYDWHSSYPDITEYFLNEGVYPVKLRVKDDDGDFGNVTKILIVGEPGPVPPEARFTWSPENPMPGQLTDFDASYSYDPDGNIVKYEWDWDGDGYYDETKFGPYTFHTWSEQGLYDVWLKVTDDDGLWGREYHTVVVGEFPADLIVEEIILPEYMVKDAPYRIDARIKNTGGKSAQYNFFNEFYYLTPNSHEWVLLETCKIFKLDPDESETVGFPIIFEEPGLHLFKVVADSSDIIDEADESNNEKMIGKHVLSYVTISTFVDYHYETQTIDIGATIYDNINQRYYTKGIAFGKIYLSKTGDPVGDTLLVYYNEELGEFHLSDVSVEDLEVGEYYTVRVSYGSPYGEAEFRNTYGKSQLTGYVYKKNGDPLSALVELYRFPDEYIGSRTSQSSGFFDFGLLDAGFYKLLTKKFGYITDEYHIEIEADWPEPYEITITLIDGDNARLAELLDRVKDEGYGLFEREIDSVDAMLRRVEKDFNTEYWETGVSIAGTIAGAILGGDADYGLNRRMALNSLLKDNFHRVWPIYRKGALRSICKNIITDFGEEAIFQIKDAFLDFLVSDPNNNFPSKQEISMHEGFITWHDEFQEAYEYYCDEALEVEFDDENFHWTRANALSNFVADILHYGRGKFYLPVVFKEPRNFIFLDLYDNFKAAADSNLFSSAVSHGFDWAKIALLVVAVVCCFIPGAQGIAAAVFTVATGVNFASTVVDIVDTGIEGWEWHTFGEATSQFVHDLPMIPSVFWDASNLILEDEVPDLKYFNKNNVLKAKINDVDIDFDETGYRNIIYVDWPNGDVRDHPITVWVENSGNIESDLFLDVNGVWLPNAYDENLGKNLYNVLPGIEEEVGCNLFIEPAKNGMRTDVREISIGAYSCLPFPETQDLWEPIYYHAVPKSNKVNALDDDSEVLLTISNSEGQMSLGKYYDILPTQQSLIDDNLSIDNNIIEKTYHIENDVKKVEFRLSYPPLTHCELSILDENGRHIGYNQTQGINEIGFPGYYEEYNNHQVITLYNPFERNYTVHVELDVTYDRNDSHHVFVDVFEYPITSAVLFVSSDEIIRSGSPGETISVDFILGEMASCAPLENVSINLTDIKNGDVDLLYTTDFIGDIGLVLPGSNIQFRIPIELDYEAYEGEYNGSIIVNADNIGPIIISVIVKVSNPPDVPTIEGPKRFKVGIEYDYSFTAVDPESEDVFYYVDWGDGNDSGWVGPYSSGNKVTLSHTWTEEGKKTISAIAKDVNDLYSPEATKIIYMPKDKVVVNSLFLRFLEMFPILQRLLYLIK